VGVGVEDVDERVQAANEVPKVARRTENVLIDIVADAGCD
jgi:hypothetical protein